MSKTCTDCDRVYPMTAIVCDGCEESLELPSYTACFAIALALAALALLAFAAVVALTGVELGSTSNLVEPSHASIRTAVIAATVIAGLAGCLAAIVDQGLRFFDPRVRSTYVGR